MKNNTLFEILDKNKENLAKGLAELHFEFYNISKELLDRVELKFVNEYSPLNDKLLADIQVLNNNETIEITMFIPRVTRFNFTINSAIKKVIEKFIILLIFIDYSGMENESFVLYERYYIIEQKHRRYLRGLIK